MKALIISLGGSPEANEAAIRSHRPDFVCFFVSHQTNPRIAEVISKLKIEHISFKQKAVLIDDPQDLLQCYDKALDTYRLVKDEGFSQNDIIVDYTGGTKTMSSALLLATIDKVSEFSYVGGTQRTKDGTGVVITGSEEILLRHSPWQFFAVEEKKRLAQYFNAYQFSAAYRIARELVEKLPEPQSTLFSYLSYVIHGYGEWDSFRHKTAIDSLHKAKQRIEPVVPFVRENEPDIENIHLRVEESLELLNRIGKKTQNFINQHRSLVVDLIANAERRSEEGKYDDAVARLYRALEMLGQIAFTDTFGVPNSNVPVEKIPDSLRDEFNKRYLQENGQLKFGLFPTVRVLNETGNTYGKKFYEHEHDFKSLLTSRNSSILAHGTTTVKEETFHQFNELIRKVFGINEIIKFPRFVW